MGEVEQNEGIWNEEWDWSRSGDEWSDWWGGTPALWYGALLPRLHAFLPAGTVLEIAPGYGRWTQYLKDLSDRLIVVDLAERCIDHCRQRFADATNIEYHTNDGRSLEMIEDGSIDFAFSFDSLVHVEADVLQAYLDQLAKKLTSNGLGFFHHSNLGSYPISRKAARKFPQRLLRPLVNRNVLIDLYAWRAETVTSLQFADMCTKAGLVSISRELISWEHGPYMIDSLSLFTVRGSEWERPERVVRNPLFRQEAKRMATTYARSSFNA
jgi:SAM-dependent methyltransferase